MISVQKLLRVLTRPPYDYPSVNMCSVTTALRSGSKNQIVAPIAETKFPPSLNAVASTGTHKLSYNSSNAIICTTIANLEPTLIQTGRAQPIGMIFWWVALRGYYINLISSTFAELYESPNGLATTYRRADGFPNYRNSAWHGYTDRRSPSNELNEARRRTRNARHGSIRGSPPSARPNSSYAAPTANGQSQSPVREYFCPSYLPPWLMV
jgi:hypothetical protein